ncbi:N-acetyl-gamma-glutamyl-phosphate reductase [Longimicrobium sp.]|uniref:N-acetyl-gamma-glutamyl-phosphate reductase n=1 Tax=Longimicrobium sp. TaxID=2029185 RepID=UPI002E32E3FC|nr:N-acetyl-gamma-glutamyl-phosphate reductase [Longimicrobium sp.]HEX6038004.1 N-acetyl-gamma-glutamyl-phosphate reductase [Longimicrobium sp.]
MNNYTRARIGILGAGGYTGRELARLLARHPLASIGWATSESDAGKPLGDVIPGVDGPALVRADDADLAGVDCVVSCLPHGDSARWMERVRAAGVRGIDLSADLRVPGASTPDWAREAVYGLPELHRERIAGAALVANPGCYPTAAILALAPLLWRGLIAGPVIINAASGVTGAGRSPRRELLFAEIAESYSAYAVGNVHRHLAEMRSQADGLAGGAAPELVFTPHLLPVKRGILETIYVTLTGPVDDARRMWADDYAGEPFVRVMDGRMPALADVTGSNRVAIGVAPVQNVSVPMLTIVSAIDNLVKGAAGQAVQNLNLLFGWSETEGLA